MIRLLVDYGASVNTTQIVGRGGTRDNILLTPLKAAAESGRVEALELLVARGADIIDARISNRNMLPSGNGFLLGSSGFSMGNSLFCHPRDLLAGIH